MNKRVLKLILVLVSMLFLNIEAAHAGLVTKLRLYIQSEIAPQQLVLMMLILSSLAVFSYIVFTPLSINNEKWPWYSYFFFNPEKNSFSNRKELVRKISSVLQQKKSGS